MFNVDLLFHAIRDTQARKLIAAAEFVKRQHAARISVPNPAPHKTPSKPGEYPRLRTGKGRAGLISFPTTLPEVIRTQQVVVSFADSAWYMLALERRWGRLGLNRTFADFKEKIADIVRED